MTLKEAIDYTIKRHPDWSCYTILETYFLLDEEKYNAAAKKGYYGYYDPAFSGGDARNYIKSIGKRAVIEEMIRNINLPANYSGDIAALVNMYSNWYNSKDKQQVKPLEKNLYINDFESLKLTFADELKKNSNNYDGVRKYLEQNCKNNNQIANFVEQVAQWMRMNYARFYNQNDLDLYLTFVNDNWNYYDIYMEKQSSNLINKCKQNTDSIMDRCGTGYKVRTLYLLYNKDEGLLPYLPSDINIDFKDAKVSIISNAVRASLINLDFETQHRIKDLYNGKSNDEIEEYSLRLQKIISFIILGQDYVQGYEKLGVYTLDITSDDVINNINRLSDSDIRFLCDLYVVTNNGNSKGKELLRQADSVTKYSLPSDKNAGSLRHYDQKQRDYLINSNINKNNNLSKLLTIVESNDFVRKLDEGSYHM